MKKKEIKQLREKTLHEFQRELLDNREKLRSLKFDLYSGKVKNVKSIHETKRIIARILTFMKELSKSK